MKAGGELAGIEFGDPIKPFAAVWIHATGFNAMTYQSMLAPLGLRQRVAALDLRGHGRSTMPAKPGRMKSWHRYRDDVIEFLADYLLDGIDRVDHNSAQSEDQTWRLTCDPKWESATFSAQRNQPWRALRKVRKHKIPIIVLRPNRSSVITPKVRAQIILMNQALMMKGVRGTSHFLPMEAPYEVRDALSAFIARLVERFTLEEDSDVSRSLSVRRRRA
jgi:pimeloyl-ACP methyl ester carboxylesterase